MIAQAYRWIGQGEGSSYALIGILAIADGNLLSAAAAGLFTRPISALIFGALCFSGVGCITTIISSHMDLKVKIIAILLVRVLSLLPGVTIVAAGIILGCFYAFSKYVAMAVVASVGLGIGLGYLPDLQFKVAGRVISVPFPLIVLVASIILSYPLSYFSSSRAHSTGPSLLASEIGLLIAVSTATALDSLAAICSEIITKMLDMKDMRLVGFICLELLAFGPIGGFFSISSYEILWLLLGSILLIILRKAHASQI